MRKLFFFILVSIMTANTAGAQSGMTGLLTWSIANDTLTISGTGTMLNYFTSGGVTTAPWGRHQNSFTVAIIENGVTRIGNNAFYGCTGLISINIGSSVTAIGSNAFVGCISLASININENNPEFSSIDGVVFNRNRTMLIQFPVGKQGDYIIPDGVTRIGDRAFMGSTGLTSVTIPNSVTTIGSRAFRDCIGLTSVSIGNNVTAIEFEAFRNCRNLTSVTIPNSIFTIGESAFRDCVSLSYVNIGARVVTIGRSAFRGCTGLTSITIPDNVRFIGESAFHGCTNLTSVSIGNGVMTIDNNAFAWCSNLTSVTSYALIPPNLGSGVFHEVEISSVSLSVPATSILAYRERPVWQDFQISTIEDVIAFGTCGAQGDNLLWILTSDSVLVISGSGYMNYFPSWFSHRNAIKTVVIENGVSNIGNWAFYESINLISITIPNSITSIGNYAFADCHSLISVNIPNSVTSIGNYAFADCRSLTSITIPNSVTVIGGSAFFRCTALQSIEVESNHPNFVSENGVLFNRTRTTLIQYPVGRPDKTYTIPAGVAVIENRAFAYSNLTSVTIPASVVRIGISAFDNCGDLVSITCYALTPPILGSLAFGGIDRSSVSLYVPEQSVELYQQTPIWQDFLIKPIQETSVTETQTAQIFVFPNPVSDSFQIGGIEENTLVKIIDLNGRTVLQQTVSPNEQISLSHLSAGVYFVKTNGKTMRIVKK